MQPALLIRLRPSTPWRIGAEGGERDRSDSVYHSDSLYSALCSAAAQLGWLDEWLEATARAASPAVRFSSCFPFQRETLLVPPPQNLWPPAGGSGKVRWKGARFVPVAVVKRLLAGEALDEEGWVVDGESGCLLELNRRGYTVGPFRTLRRSSAAVDRVTGGVVSPHTVACQQFSPGCGLWSLAVFSGEEAGAAWRGRIQASLRLLADSGFGGLRSRGFGRTGWPDLQDGTAAGLLWGEERPAAQAESQPGWWLLSLFAPAEREAVEWGDGAYRLVSRSGRVEAMPGWGLLKRTLQMVTEGSVMRMPAEPVGRAVDVAPEGVGHPVYRSGFAVALPIPWRGGAA